jgi:hypothetical protein
MKESKIVSRQAIRTSTDFAVITSTPQLRLKGLQSSTFVRAQAKRVAYLHTLESHPNPIPEFRDFQDSPDLPYQN